MITVDINPKQDLRIDFAALEGQEIELKGMVQNLRALAWGAFLILRTPIYTLQTVVDNNALPVDLTGVTVESTVKLRGKVKKAAIKDKSINVPDWELQVTAVELISKPSTDPLPIDTTKKEMNVGLDTKFDMRPLSMRHPKDRAVFKVSAAICNGFAEYLSSAGFTRICSPKIVYSGAEGGANIFSLDYFGRKAFLAQSPQFYKQMMVGVFGRVFETGPVFRAEEHNTSRHLNEYISLDFEMGFIESFMDLIQMEANLLRHVFAKLEAECRQEIELLGATIPKLEKIVAVKFAEVHEIVFKEYKKDFRGETDLEPEEERLICEYALKTWGTEFVFVTHYPSSKRPFYAKDDPSNPEETLSFDLLFRGIEITTGGQRLHTYEEYVEKMGRRGMKIELFDSYLQAFRFGMPPHGGLGLGLERLTAQICGLANVKEASLFPRDIKRLEP